MVFLHKMGAARVILKPSVIEYMKVEGSDSMQRVPKWGKTVEWKPFDIPLEFNGKEWNGRAVLDDPELIALLMAHKDYGLRFISLDENDGREVFPEDAFFVKRGERYHCVACEVPLSNPQAVSGHKTSEKHKQAVEDYITKARQAVNPSASMM